VGWHKKGKPFLILMKQEMIEWQWHQLYNHMQIICTSLQTDDHASTSLNFGLDALPVRPTASNH